MNYRMFIQYDGSRYKGWQRLLQEDTIQGRIEQVLSDIEGQGVLITGSGRTDAGVHAIEQVANFTTDRTYDTTVLRDRMNEKLPEDIRIQNIDRVSEGFHSRYHAKSKIYEYRIHAGDIRDVFHRKYVYEVPQMPDVERMRAAAEKMCGVHDFAGFSSVKKSKDGREKDTVRNLMGVTINCENNNIVIEYEGDGFLYNMVRILTGTLLEIGENKKKLEDIDKIFLTKNRVFAGVTVPPTGLFLKKVKF